MEEKNSNLLTILIIVLVVILIIFLFREQKQEDFTTYAPVNFDSRILNCNELAYNPENCGVRYAKPRRERICNKNNIIEKKKLEYDNLTSLESIPDVKSLNSIDQENTYE